MSAESYTDPKRYGHRASSYERPGLKYRCGREALWGKPCPLGPNGSGECRGTSACEPRRKDDRWECTRPASAGGPCAEGPLPDGSCCLTHPPCRPRLTIRAWRGRLTALAAILTVALIAFFVYGDRFASGGGAPLAADPGPLSQYHQGFLGDQGCRTCHESHGSGVTGWFEAAVTDGDMTLQCLSCHTFEGVTAPAARLHNFPGWNRYSIQMECTQCHTEHRGTLAAVTTAGEKQCAACHDFTFASHPEFAGGYPHRNENAIRFDHHSHLETHFKDPRVDNAPATCTGCHEVSVTQAAVSPVSFQRACESCHANDIMRTEFTLLSYPKLDPELYDAKEIEKECGAKIGSRAKGARSLADPHALLAGLDGGDDEAFAEPAAKFFAEMTEDGTKPLSKLVKKGGGDPALLLRGLSPELAKAAACTWVTNERYKAPGDLEGAGWEADRYDLNYMPAGHGDPVMKAWLDFALTRDDRALLDDFTKPNKELGKCAKCHTVSEQDGAARIAWHYGAFGQTSRYHYFDHGPHLRLLGADQAPVMATGEGCATCHALNSAADYRSGYTDRDPATFTPNFDPITTATCDRCHSQQAVRSDCLTCHRYHTEPGFLDAVAGGAHE